MGDVNHGGSKLLVEFRYLHTHLNPEGGVKVGERLIKEKDPGLLHQATANGYPLALTAGK